MSRLTFPISCLPSAALDLGMIFERFSYYVLHHLSQGVIKQTSSLIICHLLTSLLTKTKFLSLCNLTLASVAFCVGVCVSSSHASTAVLCELQNWLLYNRKMPRRLVCHYCDSLVLGIFRLDAIIFAMMTFFEHFGSRLRTFKFSSKVVLSMKFKYFYTYFNPKNHLQSRKNIQGVLYLVCVKKSVT